MMDTTEAQNLLDDLRHDVKSISRVMLASVDGLPVLPLTLDSRVASLAAVGATVVGLGSRIGSLTDGGEFVESVIRGEDALLAAYHVDEEIVLVVVATHEVNLAHLNLRARLTARRLATPTPMAHQEPAARHELVLVSA
jgi:predicted regulator of Ras-like GTPase activity (Roadblock/LC7/MglB family)